MGKIEEWYKRALLNEMEKPSIPPNLILGILSVYYYLIHQNVSYINLHHHQNDRYLYLHINHTLSFIFPLSLTYL